MTKTKKELRKEATALANRISKNLKAANECENPITGSLAAFMNVSVKLQSNQNDSNAMEAKSLKIQFYKSPLPQSLHDSCLSLFEKNMGDMYRQSSWGLNMKEKDQELKHPNARYLVILDEEQKDDSKLLAFAHFRFEVDDEEHPSKEVLYLYEIQIHESAQRNGIGKRMMQILEILAMQMQMRKVVLTVFNSNTGAMDFYQKLKYNVDETSPSQYEGEEADYEILSKVVFKD
jgi:ribosomal protein S18 acetylase RimI-like enzyme